MKIAVIDGQGGTIGATIIRKIKQSFGEEVEIWALGTNAVATSQMMKAGANRGATGESAICWSAGKANAIIGAITILVSHGFLGEITPPMVHAIGASRASKLLLPFTQEALAIVGTTVEPLPHMVDTLVNSCLTPLVFRKKGPPQW